MRQVRRVPAVRHTKTMKEFEVELRLRNNLLKERRLELGLNCKQMAAAVGVAANLYSGLETMRDPPVHRRSGEWRPSALAIARFHGLSPDELWPDAIRLIKQATTLRRVSVGQLTALVGGTNATLALGVAEQYDTAELRKALHEAVAQLPSRVSQLLTLRYGLNGSEPMTLEQVGTVLGICRERVAQIERVALRTLRHPSHPVGQLGREHNL